MREQQTIQKRRNQIRARIRAKLSGTPERPRLHVYISNLAVTAQLVDDVAGKTLGMATSLHQKDAGKTMTDKATWVGSEVAKVAAKLSITTVVFDRGRHRYHGRVKALAEGARAAGLKF